MKQVVLHLYWLLHFRQSGPLHLLHLLQFGLIIYYPLDKYINFIILFGHINPAMLETGSDFELDLERLNSLQH